MSMVKRCDGCKRDIGPAEDSMAFEREQEHLAGGDLPYGSGHWCNACARIAFAAVAQARQPA